MGTVKEIQNKVEGMAVRPETPFFPPTFPPVFLSQIFLFIPSCSFDAVDNMAEHEEFLPHKSGVKKESRFTDVSAHTQWGLLGFAV